MESDDLRNWLGVSNRVMAGEFKFANKSAKEAIRIGLRATNHPDAKAAITMLDMKETQGALFPIDEFYGSGEKRNRRLPVHDGRKRDNQQTMARPNSS